MAERNDDWGKMTDAMFEGYALLRITEGADHKTCNGRIVESNEAFAAMFGLSRDGAVDKTIEQILPEVCEGWSNASKSTAQPEEPVQFEFFLKNTDRQFFVRALYLSGGMATLFFMETTLQKKAKDTLRLHETLFENASDIVLYIKFDGQIVNANKRACEQYGYTKQQLSSMTIQQIRHPSTVTEYEHQMRQADDEGITFECIHVRKDGSSFPVEVSAKSANTKNGQFRIHIIRDITKRKESDEKIAWLAKYDALTGIENRASFLARLEEEIQRSVREETPFAVMLFDIDKFKHINDCYGHSAGDVVLRHVAQAGKRILRSGDQISRFGGDEFVVLQMGIKSIADVEALARRIQSSVNETVTHESMQANMQISLGISLFPKDARDANALLHCADKAMYQAKQSGGGSYCFFAPCKPPCAENRLCLGGHKENNS